LLDEVSRDRKEAPATGEGEKGMMMQQQQRQQEQEHRITRTFVVDPPREVQVTGTSRGQARRAGKYDILVTQLVEARITPADFRARVQRWAPFAGYRFLADPDAVLALVETARGSGNDRWCSACGGPFVGAGALGACGDGYDHEAWCGYGMDGDE
jgi:hypothetical protein